MVDNIEERIKKIIVEQIGTKDFSDLDNLETDLDMDSLDRTEFIMNLETEFHLEIPDDVWDRLETVSGAVNYIKERIHGH